MLCTDLLCRAGQASGVDGYYYHRKRIIISGFRLVASDNGIVIAASWWGKSKTISQMIMIILLIADIPALSVLNTVLIWVALILTVVSLIDYLVKNKNVLSMQN